jgi:hypothetical protein
MGLESWMSVEKGGFESAEVFVQPPFRSRQFLAATILVALLGLLDIGTLARLWERLTFKGDVCVLLMFVTAFGGWLRAFVIHKRLHELWIAAKLEDSLAGSPTDVALRAVSSLSYWGPSSAAAVGFCGIGALIIVFLSSQGR